ncbi:MAG: PKD domain-containing protein [Tangfeifania sp.]
MRIQFKLMALFFVFTLQALVAGAQENFASNIAKSVSDDEKLLITYDINPTGGAKSFTVVLLITYQGKQVETSSAYGDIGSNINPGNEKAIVWYFKDDFDGDINNAEVDVFAYKENEPRAIFEIASLSNNGYAPCTVTFKNRSEFANEYQWNFGDPEAGSSNLSFEENPTHVFENGGIYSIALIARNTQSRLENIYYHSIEIKEYEPTIAGFEIIGNNQLAPAKVEFKNTSENADTYQWDFGDSSFWRSNQSDKKNPDHKYKDPGTYRVKLIVKNNFSGIADTLIKDVVVEKEKEASAGFVFTKSSDTAPSTVAFKNTSEDAERFEWDFGDPASGSNNSSDEKDPAHLYSKPGSYNVRLSAWAKGQRNPTTFSEVIEINELPRPPEAAFTIENNNVLGPATIVFNNKSVNAEEFSWNFGDPDSGSNNMSNKENPTHTYQKAGRYKVELTASSSNFNTKSTATDYVIIVEPSQPPAANFTFDSSNLISPVEVSFTNSSVNADSYLWDFGDPQSANNTSSEKSPSHTYNEAGKYKVVLTATNKKTGEKSSFSEFIVVTGPAKPAIRPVAKFSVETENVTAPATVRFTNQSADATAYEWDFGDPDSGRNSSDEANPTHTYEEPGRYRVELKVTNSSSGLTNTYSDFITVSKPEVIPVADFDIQNNNTEAPATIVFSNKSDNANSFAWEFGDPSSGIKNTSTLKNPEHEYEKPGTYTVELTVLNKESGKEDFAKKTVTVKKPLEPPVASFEMTFNGEYVPINIDFKNNSKNADSFKWNFGDFDSEDNESTLEAPVHKYVVPGTYKITLTAFNSETGEKNEVSKEITLKSNFSTFVKTTELGRKSVDMPAVVSAGENAFFGLTKKDKNKSSLFKFDLEGNIIDEIELDFLATDLFHADDELITMGIESTDKLVLQKINPNFELAEKVDFQQRKKFVTDNFPPVMALSITDELGVAANSLDDKYPIDILFQKAEKSGRIIPLVDRTFKYVGTKLVTGLVPTNEGGFALTGYWKEKEKSPMLILFGKIDRKGHGEMHLISSEMNIIGCDIEESYQDGFAILRAKEGLESGDIYEMSFILIDSDGGPTDCATMLPCTINKDDILKYRPRLIKIKSGYVVASHGFNGVDYDVSLFWIDKSGDVLMRYEEIRLPGNQFVTDFAEAGDGGFIISGTNGSNALLIKTDSYGKLNTPVLP